MQFPLVATYRLQLEPAFPFARAAELASYLRALGVSHVYLSPSLQANPGSRHGYDVTDATRWSDELGGEDGFERLRRTLREHDLGIVLDIVPNHMAASTANPWWRDVLVHGRESRFADVFDVDWTDPLALPVLEDSLARSFEEGRLHLVRRPHGVVVDVGTELPLAVPSLRPVLERAAQRSDSSELAVRARSPTLDWQPIAQMLEADPEAAEAFDGALREVQDDPAALFDLLEHQAYRLIDWHDAPRSMNYRRFADITDLVCVRAEDPRVFALVHGRVLEALENGMRPALEGLRVDHVDGLRDPLAYLRRLRARAPEAGIWVEKILAPDEELPAAWPIEGTTGYELARLVDGVLLDPAGEEHLTRFHAEFVGESRTFAEIAREARREVLEELFSAELAALARRFVWLARRRSVRLPERAAQVAVREVLAALRVYRTYLDAGVVTPQDVRSVSDAVRAAGAAHPELLGPLMLLRDLLLAHRPGTEEREFVLRFQQLAPSVAAKGVEDTAFYRYVRLLALNEVGGDPDAFGIPPAEFHRAMCARQERWPLALSPGSTHDSKLSADVRARLLVLAEMPERWSAAVRRWSARAARLDPPLPDRLEEYTLYQLLVGAWPLATPRAQATMRKAAREAKRRTSWLHADERHEEHLDSAIVHLLGQHWFQEELAAFAAPTVELGRINSLAATLIRCTAPGVPDVYQGSELWDLRLVDPDNREPVDFGARERALAAIGVVTLGEVRAGAERGWPKLHVLRRALALRRRLPRAFGPQGAYEPLEARGARAGHVLAFLRGGGALIVAPRLVLGIADGWGDTTLTLPRGRWRDELTGAELAGKVRLAELLARFPVALLARAPG